MLNDVYTLSTFIDDTVRVLYLFDDMLVVISLVKENSLPYFILKDEIDKQYDIGNVKLINDINFSFVMEQSEKQVSAGEKNWDIIKDLVQDEPYCFDKKIRSTYIHEKSVLFGITRFQLQRLLYKYWARGKVKFAVYPDYSKRGAPGKERITDKKLGRPVEKITDNKRFSLGSKDKENIKAIINKYYNRNDKKYTYHKCYNKLLKEYYTDKTTGMLLEGYPTETQFLYNAKKKVDIRKHVGEIPYDKDKRGITGSSRSEADGPGDAYQIDATIADVYLVSKDDRSVLIGRPILYFVLDVFSRMIVGFHCCLEYASWNTAKIALLCAFSNKAQYCKRFGKEISEDEWPCSGLPKSLVVDNGELISLSSDKIIENLRITVKNTPAWRPDLKGIVESSFRLLNLDVRSDMPGGVYPDFTLRTGRDYRYDAKLTLEEFSKVILIHVLGYNKRLMKENPQCSSDIRSAHVPPIPIELWRWGTIYRVPALRKMDEETLKIALMASGEARVTEKGIKFHNLYYTCDRAMAEKWFDVARGQGSWKIPIAYNQSDMSQIYYVAGKNKYEICRQTNDSAELFAGLTLEEVQHIQYEQNKLKSEYERIDLQNQIDTDREIERIIAEAENQRKIASVIKISPKEMQKNRKKEVSKNKDEEKAPIITKENHIQQPRLFLTNSRYDLIVSNFFGNEDDEQ